MKFKILFLLLIFIPFVSSAVPVSLYDQGLGVKDRATGQVLTSGNLRIEIYDNISLGNLIYSETFNNAIQNGNWNIYLGEDPLNPLNLEYGRKYYRDYFINDIDMNFVDNNGNIVERQVFYSPLGSISSDYFSTFYGLTNQTYTGKIEVDGLLGYNAANKACENEFSNTHICNQREIITTIQSSNLSSIADWRDNAWVTSGGSKYPSPLTASDCEGFTIGDSTALGNFWIFNVTTGGRGSIVNCAQIKSLACCI